MKAMLRQIGIGAGMPLPQKTESGSVLQKFANLNSGHNQKNACLASFYTGKVGNVHRSAVGNLDNQ